MKVAAIDLGTNSFLCLIAEIQNSQVVQVLSDEVQIVRLGQGVNQTKAFHPEALERAKLCLQDFKQTIAFHQPQKILAMATSAARDVTNAKELFQIGADLGIPIEVIQGPLEAELTFKGALSGFPKDQKRRAVIDIGGGSTEIISGAFQEPLVGQSVNVGAVRLTEQFFPQQPPTSAQLQSAREHLQAKLKTLIQLIAAQNVTELIAVAGTPTELVAATLGKFDLQAIEGAQLAQADLANWIQKFMQTTSAQRMAEHKISKGRSDIILAGTVILEMILRDLKFSSLTVSARGVRYGIALEIEKRFSSQKV